MILSATTNESEFNEALKRFINQNAVEMPKALRFQGKLLAQRLIEFTPPKTNQQGRAAVAKDISQLFFGIKKDAPGVEQLIQGKPAVRLYSTDEGIFGVEKKNYRPDASEAALNMLHTVARNRRGRVSKNGDKTVDIGKWKFIDKLAVKESVLKKYISHMQSGVGAARGGWVAALRGLGGTCAQWYARHAAGGRLEDKSNDPVSAYILMQNNSKWGKSGGDDLDNGGNVIQQALETRARDIETSLQKAQFDAMKRAVLK